MIISGKCKCNIGRNMRHVQDDATPEQVAVLQSKADAQACEGCPDCNPNYKPIDWTAISCCCYHYSPWERVRQDTGSGYIDRLRRTDG